MPGNDTGVSWPLGRVTRVVEANRFTRSAALKLASAVAVLIATDYYLTVYAYQYPFHASAYVVTLSEHRGGGLADIGATVCEPSLHIPSVGYILDVQIGSETPLVIDESTIDPAVRLEKRGDYFYAFAAGPKSDVAGKLQPTGASIKLALTGDFYIGIGVCSHDKTANTTATFRNVKLAPLTAARRLVAASP